LGFAISGNDDGLIHPLVNTGFEQERYVVDHHGVGIFPCGLFREPGLFARDAGVDDSFKPTQLAPVSEHDGSQRMAIEGTVTIKDVVAERVDDLSPGRLAWFDDVSRKFIGIDHDRTPLPKHSGNRAFAGGDAACESDEDHGGGAYHAGCCPTRNLIDISVPALV